ncbi:PREDICTED: venom carboxylesterase-6-like [Rhagoletis zephyria]|uniref:venom carboxylesterase-6-like n=1 Tax=Rhagoletis zephyria TaxID=28612 RepID=UPI0008114465|nr:PREDICTED: venom carboxylesterase-6-like [Rhagoletis zephyria]
MANGQEMIVVTVNYRLGVFGFLSTDDVNQPGNNGIRDQLLSLQWINQNIGLFQGNPNQVTIMGHDAGGVSVGMHLLNQDAAKYFRSAVSISGTVFSPWAFEDVPVQQARDFGYRFGCPYQTDKLVECLRYADANSLIQTTLDSVDVNSNRNPFWFRAVVDKNVTTSALLADFPQQLYQAGKNNRVPYLVAGTSNEGSLEFYLQSERVKSFQELDAKIAFLIRPYLKHYTNEDAIAAAFSFKYFNRTHRAYSASGTGNLFSGASNPYSQQSAISQNNAYNTFGHLNQYGGSNTGSGVQYGTVSGYNELQSNQIFSQMLGDYLYLAPMDNAAKLHAASGAEVIMLVFDYTGSKSFGTLQIGAPSVSRDNYGATHNNDLWYSWLNEYDLTPLTGNEFTLYRSYSSFLAQFVLLGTASKNFLRYTPQTPNYVSIRFPSTQTTNVVAQFGRGYRTDYFDFLNDFLAQLIEKSKIFPPYFPIEEYKSYQTATWSLVGVVILVVVLVVIAGAILFLRKKDNGPSEQVRLKRRRDESDPLNG